MKTIVERIVESETAGARCAGSACSVPWAWTHSPDSEYWNPAGKSRDEAIAAGKRRGYSKFWIAQTRKMTADEREEYDGTWIVDPTTHELITPNTRDDRRRATDSTQPNGA